MSTLYNRIFLILVLLLSPALSLSAQTGSSRISGTVTDASGAVLEGAQVTATNEATGVAVTQVTTSGGIYAFASLPAGTYTITVEQSGFKKTVKTGNVVEVDTPLNVDVALEIGNVTETVTVQAEGIAIQTSTATIGNVVDQRTIENLPLNGRNPLTLVLLEPGVVQRSAGATGSGVHVNGARDRAYNVTIDGIDANESSVPNPVSNLYRLNPDNVQEFKVTTNNATANEGRNSGASISLSTRGGGNEFHGTGFWFIRNDAFNSTEWFANALGEPKRDTKLHQYGFEFSGPIIKNKTFFFGSWQQNRVNFTQPIDQTFGIPIVYTASARAGIFRYFRHDPANPLVIGTTTITSNSPLLVDPTTGALRSDIPICASDTQRRCVFVYNIATRGPAGTTLDPSVLSYLNTLPLPNRFSVGVGDGLNTGGFLWNPPTAIRGPAYNVRIDHNLNSTMSVFGRYLYSDYNTLEGDPLNSRPQVFPGFAPLGEVFRKTSNFVVGYRWNISPYVTNEFRFGYSKFNFLFTQGEANPDFPDISPVNFNSISEPYNNTPRTQREVFTPQFIDDLTIVHGEHVFGIGLNFRFYRHRDVRGQPGGVNVTPAISMDTSVRPLPAVWLTGASAPPGLTTGTDFTLFQNTVANVLGRPARISQVFIADLENDTFLPFIDANGNVSLFDEKHIASQYNLYVQDEWKARRNLTLNLGVRWEYNPPAHTKDGKTFVAESNILAGPTTFVPADGWYENEKFGVFGPSLGLVWGPEFKKGFLKSVFGESGKSAIRLGYRIAYDTISTFQVTAAAGRVPGLLVSCAVIPGVTPAPATGCPSVPDTTLGSGFPQQLTPPTLRPSSFFRLPTALNNVAPPITVFAPEMKTPTVHQWSVSWQRELPWGIVAQAAYVGRRGTHLFYARNMNQINPEAILPDFLLMQENMRRGCVPSGQPSTTGGTRNLPGRICMDPITNIPLIVNGFITASAVNGLASSTISPGLPATGTASAIPAQNAAGAFAEQIENRTLAFRMRANQQFSTITYLDNSGDSNYHAAQFTLRRRFASGLGLTAAYTFGKSIDNQSVDPVGASSGGGLTTTTSRAPVDARNLSIEKARSDFDRRHVFTMSAIWDIPVGRGRYFFSNAPGWLNQIIGGWTINGLSTWMTGEPFSVRSNARTSNSGHDSRADVLDPNLRAGLFFLPNIDGPVVFENADGFAVPPPLGNGAGRNIFNSPGYYNLDIGIIKQFSITERIKLDFRTEIFNALNRVNFDNPRDASVGSPSIQSSLFAQTCCTGVAPPSTQTIIQTGESARVIQFALKLKF